MLKVHFVDPEETEVMVTELQRKVRLWKGMDNFIEAKTLCGWVLFFRVP